MTVELYERTNEKNKLHCLSEISSRGDRPKESVDNNAFLGSPIPKHRRQQQLQENIQASRGKH